MCAKWEISGDKEHAPVTLSMLIPDAVALEQGDSRVVLGAKQIGNVDDKLYFLNQVLQSDLQDALDALCCPHTE